MDQTTNYSLKKPGTNENVDITVINENMDTIDAQLKANANDTASKANSSDLTNLEEDYTTHKADNVQQFKRLQLGVRI